MTRTRSAAPGSGKPAVADSTIRPMNSLHVPAHHLPTVNALSPLDGRYANKLSALRPLMSEQGYMHRRVQVEIAWFIALSDAGFAEFKPLSPGART